MSGVLIKLPVVPSLDTVFHNSRVLFVKHCLMSSNKIVQWSVTTLCLKKVPTMKLFVTLSNLN